MPNYDGGRYFLTALVPIKPGVADDSGSVRRSHEQILRDTLARMPAAKTVIDGRAVNSPFARNTRTHLARFAVIDDVSFNGRMPGNPLSPGYNPLIPENVDGLNVPYLLFAADIDAATAGKAALDTYLDELWQAMEPDLRAVFGHCIGFEGVTDSGSFIYFIRRCQVETTMPFNDYWEGTPPLKSFPLDPVKTALKNLGCLAGVVAVPTIALIALWITACFFSSAGRFADWSFPVFGWGLVDWIWVGLGALAVMALLALIVALVTLVAIMRAGKQPFPAAPDATLKDVLKALYLQQAFTDFAIANQQSGDADLHKNFGLFVGEHKPAEVDGPTQQPGVIRSWPGELP